MKKMITNAISCLLVAIAFYGLLAGVASYVDRESKAQKASAEERGKAEATRDLSELNALKGLTR